jgi:hypothetical protein
METGAGDQSSGEVISRGLSHMLAVPVQLEDPASQRVYIEWRGLALASPPTLEMVSPFTRVPIARRWTEIDEPFLKLIHPDKGTQVDYIVRWITKTSSACFALLELAPGWPSEGSPPYQTIVEVLDRDMLWTLTADEFSRALPVLQTDINIRGVWPKQEAEQVFGDMPDWLSPRFRAESVIDEEAREVRCFHCEEPIQDSFVACPYCGASRVAPCCPECGKPVTEARDKRAYYHSENGRYPWHYAWDGRCRNCGVEFASRLSIATGHLLFFEALKGGIEDTLEKLKREGRDAESLREGASEMEIRAGEGVYSMLDDWDYQPTIEVTIRRAVASNMNAPSGLSKEERIVLTTEEARALIEELQGRLRILMERKKWSRDTT